MNPRLRLMSGNGSRRVRLSSVRLGDTDPGTDLPAVTISDDGSLETAQFEINDSAQTLTQLTAQVAGGDLNAKTNSLPAALNYAKGLRALYVANVPGIDTGAVDRAITNATAALSAGGVPAMFSAAGIRIGSIQISWFAAATSVTVIGIAIATLIHVEKKKRAGGRRRTRSKR